MERVAGDELKKVEWLVCSSSAVLKNDADSQFGKLSGKRYKSAKVKAQISTSRLPTRYLKPDSLPVFQFTEPRHQSNHDVGERGHLQQLHVSCANGLERSRDLTQENTVAIPRPNPRNIFADKLMSSFN